MKRWQRRFDTEGDVDLLDATGLYDPNTIGSMLKSWLRDLPTDILSKSAQLALAQELEKDNPEYHRVGQSAPQKLRDALSDLPPFNYYLLFAITCHLSLLLSHKDKNRMDLHNLNICIGPPLRLEPWLFNYLVGDWRHCWQGCFTEKQYLEAEKALEEGREYQLPNTHSEEDGGLNAVVDDRAVSSSGSGSGGSKPASRDETALDGESQPRGVDNARLESYRPVTSASHTRQTNGTARTPLRSPPPEVKRPSTADEKTGSSSGENSKASTPKRAGHNRTKSDLPSSPVQPSAEETFPFPMPAGRP